MTTHAQFALPKNEIPKYTSKRFIPEFQGNAQGTRTEAAYWGCKTPLVQPRTSRAKQTGPAYSYSQKLCC